MNYKPYMICLKWTFFIIYNYNKKKIDLKTIQLYKSYYKMATQTVDYKQSPIIDASIDIPEDILFYTAPKSHASGGKVVNLLNKYTKESITLAIPLMSAWGAQEVMQKRKDGTSEGTGKYTMSLQFATGEYNTPSATKCLENLKKLDTYIKTKAMENSKEWFGKEIKNFDVVEEKFSPMLKYPKLNKESEERDYNKPPSMTLKLPCWKDVWQTTVFDEDQQILYNKNTTPNHSPDITPLNFLTSSSKMPLQVICLIQCGGLWFVNGKVSVTWNLRQVVVKKPKTSSISDDTCVLIVRNEERELLKSLPETEVAVLDSHVESALVEDSDDEKDIVLPVKKSEPEPVLTPPTPVVTSQVVTPPVVTKEETETKEEPKKKKVVKKKTDA